MVGVQQGQANDQEEAQTPEAAMEAATQEAVKQLKEAQEMVQKLVDNGSTAQHIADALVFLNNAVEYFKENDSAENAAGTLKTMKKASKSMAGPCKKSKPSAQEQRPVETPEQEKVKDAERALRDVVCFDQDDVLHRHLADHGSARLPFSLACRPEKQGG